MKHAKSENSPVTRIERTGSSARVFNYAGDVLGSRASAEQWLATPNIALGGVTPESLLGTDRGAAQVETILGRIEHGVYS